MDIYYIIQTKKKQKDIVIDIEFWMLPISSYKFTMTFMFRATQVPQKTPQICVAVPGNEACQMRPADVSSSVGERGALGSRGRSRGSVSCGSL